MTWENVKKGEIYYLRLRDKKEFILRAAADGKGYNHIMILDSNSNSIRYYKFHDSYYKPHDYLIECLRIATYEEEFVFRKSVETGKLYTNHLFFSNFRKKLDDLLKNLKNLTLEN